MKSEAILVTGLGSLRVYGSETLRIPYCLESRLTDGSKAVSPTHRQCSIPQKPQGLVTPEGLGKLKKIH
jgi:hypothetical protein